MLPSILWIFVSIFKETRLFIQFYSDIHEICYFYQRAVSDDGINMFFSVFWISFFLSKVLLAKIQETQEFQTKPSSK